jgi:transcriptional regulator with XRE-family HTH domain
MKDMAPTYPAAVGAAIKARRKQLGWTLAGLANQLNSDVGNISRIEKGKQGVNLAKLNQIAIALHIKPSWLLQQAENNYVWETLRRINIDLCWDPEASVWVAESHGIGVVTEADSISEVFDRLAVVVPTTAKENRQILPSGKAK